MVFPTIKLRILTTMLGGISFVVAVLAAQATKQELIKKNIRDEQLQRLWASSAGVKASYSAEEWTYDNRDGTFTSGTNSVLTVKVDNDHRVVNYDHFLSYASMTLWTIAPNQEGVLYIKIVSKNDEKYDWKKLVADKPGHEFFIIEKTGIRVVTFRADQIPILRRTYPASIQPSNLTTQANSSRNSKARNKVRQISFILKYFNRSQHSVSSLP